MFNPMEMYSETESGVFVECHICYCLVPVKSKEAHCDYHEDRDDYKLYKD